ncbi:uncharacterized protein FTOL_01472 [Fusarium torulosum]|uniref:Heterokaryon incompatibility domain-containing protein n=1 Tax=Fusarium torulosum TaxID=33205 RepID=A0AAE8SDW6_9HYPO|nr:uncharacterized protein FTOL_01472 [Fusarium torulosum]
MSDDSNIPLSHIVKCHGKSIASLLLEIEKNQKPQCKYLDFINELECLAIYEGSSEGPRLKRQTINAFKEQHYVALSYTWDTSDQENPRKGKYMVETRDKSQYFPSPVRDCVFDRVFSFMRAKGLGLLWIDRHCVKQKVCNNNGMCPHKRCKEKQRAVETMDLVYSLSKHPVALLGKPIEWEDEVDLLFKILDRQLVKRFAETSHQEILQALRLLSRITKDRWWTRAWTFQENYRAGVDMTLLIPHPQFLEAKKQGYRIFSDIPKELCIKSVDFCEASTEFCLAVQAQMPQRDDISQHTKSIFQVIGKYTLLLDKSMSMTPKVITDIQTRGLSDAWDKLAIIANCCQYALRMNHKEMQTPKSLSVSILAMCLLNGEILLNGSREDPFSMLEKTISQYLEDQAFKWFCAPRRKSDLTFNKGCRFVDVQFRPSGIETKGHLWKLGRIIDTARFRLPLPKVDKSSCSLSENEQQRLTQLAAELRLLGETSVASQIEKFLNHDPNRQGETFKSEPFSRQYLCLMAEELAAAIEKGKLLRLGRVWNSPEEEVPSSAIFVWDSDNTERNIQGISQNINNNSKRGRRPKKEYAFTASRPLKRGSQQQGTNDLDHHVSLEVEWPLSRKQDPHSLPRLYVKRWAVGMCFFYGIARREVIFPWPSTFQTVIP